MIGNRLVPNRIGNAGRSRIIQVGVGCQNPRGNSPNVGGSVRREAGRGSPRALVCLEFIGIRQDGGDFGGNFSKCSSANMVGLQFIPNCIGNALGGRVVKIGVRGKDSGSDRSHIACRVGGESRRRDPGRIASISQRLLRIRGRIVSSAASINPSPRTSLIMVCRSFSFFRPCKK